MSEMIATQFRLLRFRTPGTVLADCALNIGMSSSYGRCRQPRLPDSAIEMTTGHPTNHGHHHRHTTQHNNSYNYDKYSCDSYDYDYDYD